MLNACCLPQLSYNIKLGKRRGKITTSISDVKTMNPGPGTHLGLK
jgi:hypothetical protein